MYCHFKSWLPSGLFSTLMPPKREPGAPQTQPEVKMIKIGPDAQGFGCDPVEEKYRMAEESSYSPFPNNEVGEFYLYN